MFGNDWQYVNELFPDINIYLETIKQKKRAFVYHRNEIIKIIDSVITNLEKGFYYCSGDTKKTENDLDFLINIHFSGFLINTISSFDVLSCLINNVYECGESKPDFFRINGKIISRRCNTELAKIIKINDWYIELNKYRRINTHRRIIEFKIKEENNITMSNPKSKRYDIFIPDDPEAKEFTFNKNKTLKHFLEKIDKNLDQNLQKIYNAIEKDVKELDVKEII